VIAFVLAVLATFGATLLGSIAGYNIGLGTGREIALRPMDIDFDWSILTPVREWVLLGELSFWVGTILGIWALVQGIVAIVKNRGRGWGIAAVIVAVIGPIAFATGVQAFLAAGFASGASIGG
jgi:outer membrane lipoprotein SlyB